MRSENKVLSEFLNKPFYEVREIVSRRDKKVIVSQEVIDEVSSKYNFGDFKKYVEDSIIAKLNIFKYAQNKVEVMEVAREVEQKSTLTYDAEVYEGLIRKLRIARPDSLKIYKDLMKGVCESKNESDDNLIVEILIQASLFKLYANNELDIEKVLDNLKVEVLNNYNGWFKNELVDSRIIKMYKVLGYNKVDYLLEVSKILKKHKELVNEVFESVKLTSEEEKISEPIKEIEAKPAGVADLIGDLFFNELGDTKPEELRVDVKAKEKKKEKKKEESKDKVKEEPIEKKEDVVYKNLNGLANTLGYKIAKQDEVVIASEKLDIQLETAKTEIIRELVRLDKGASLSELYNAYQNLGNISKENLEAVLGNFFTTLTVAGLEVVDADKKVGEEIEVDFKDVLKEFKLETSISKRENIKGHVKYLGWEYKGKKIEPMIISPIK